MELWFHKQEDDFVVKYGIHSLHNMWGQITLVTTELFTVVLRLTEKICDISGTKTGSFTMWSWWITDAW